MKPQNSQRTESQMKTKVVFLTFFQHYTLKQKYINFNAMKIIDVTF